MMNWRTLLVVVGFGLLVVASAWLQELATAPAEPAAAAGKRMPESELSGYRIDLYDTAGRPRYRLAGPRLVHYADDDSTHLEAPRTTLLDAGTATWRATAGQGEVSAGATRIELAGQVLLERLPGAEREALSVRTERLVIEPPREVAETDAPVHVRGPRYEIDAVGMRVTAVGESHVVELLSQVRARHDPLR